MRIVHIGQDSGFIRFIGEIFEWLAPGQNEFFVLHDGGPTLHRREYRGEISTFHPRKISSSIDMVRKSRGADLVIAHGLSSQAAIAFASLRGNTVKMWSGWGWDYYGSGRQADRQLLDPLSRAAFDNHDDRAAHSVAAKVRSVTRDLLVARAIGEADFFSAPIPEDYEIMQNTYPQFKGAYAQLNYADVESSFATASRRREGTDILIGNSASYTNNHLEVFELLARFPLENRKIIVPLTYGDGRYRADVMRIGRQRFGESFIPLVEQMPLAHYLETIASCNVVVMNHRRQQALGNIGAAIYAGSHLFLHPKSPMVRSFDRMGVRVGLTSDLDMSSSLPTDYVEDSVRDNHRRALQSFWGRERVIENVANLLQAVEAIVRVDR